MADVLFDTVKRLQGSAPWGDVLDAGTGLHSLRWLTERTTRSITAITGAWSREVALRSQLGGVLRPSDRLLTANWSSPSTLAGETFDVVLADYLLGAIDGFAPYYQDQLFERLRPHVRGTLYVIGMEPLPDSPASTPATRAIQAIHRLRDACILLAGHRPYREYPLTWVERNLVRSGFTVTHAEQIGICFRARHVNRQLDVCLRKLEHLPDSELAAALRAHIERLREEALSAVQAEEGARLGSDWVVAARPAHD